MPQSESAAMRHRQQQGLTLVELMVALTIGSLVLLFLVEIFAQASQNSRVQRNIAWMQEDGRNAIEVITREIRLAGLVPASIAANRGLKNKVTVLTPWSMPSGCSVAAPTEPQSIAGKNDINLGAGLKTDAIVIAYMSDGHINDCNGGSTTNNQIVVSCIDIKDSISDSDDIPNLRIGCPSSSGMQPILNNIVGFEVLYGVASETPTLDIDPATTEMTIKYVADPSTIPSDDQKNIISVRINLLVRSRDGGIAPSGQTYWFDSDGNGNPTSIYVNDGYLRQSFSSVVLLRNRIP